MNCNRCKNNIPEFLWIGDDHPIMTNHPVTMQRQDMLDNPNEFRVTVHAYATKQMCSQTSDFPLIFPEWTTETPVETAVFEALGAASVCWETPEGAGVFESDRAKQIGDELVAFFISKWAT